MMTLRKVMAAGAIVLGGLVGVGAASPAHAGVYLGGVDMQGACNNQYPGMGLRAVVLDQRNAYSWVCTSPWGYRQGIDVTRQCRVQYGWSAYAGLWDSRNPYSWFCQR
jgi:hypothetical protein